MLSKENLDGELNKLPEISELLLIILSRIPRNNRREIVELHSAIDKNLLEIKTLFSNMAMNHLSGRQKFENIHFPIYIQHMLNTKRMVNDLFRHVNLFYRPSHFENVVYIKDTITNLIKILSNLMNEQVIHEQSKTGKRKGTQSIRRGNSRKDKTNKKRISA